ncbi:hypothetical protein ACN9MN_03150 [Chryseobacterium sp. S-02]|uniref:hypothetical protein n=1 Tax=Chryseobacterium sp. S-02 TaxID=3404064 RepID=UPI003CEF32BD
MKNNMLNKLKSSYEEFEIKPSSNLWNRLDEKLDEKPEMQLKPSFQWWKYAAVIVVLISLGSLFYFNSGQNSQTEIVKKFQKTSENVPEPTLKQDESIILSENIIENHSSSTSDKNKEQSNFSSEKLSERIEQPQDIAPTQKENVIVELPAILAEKKENNSVQPLVADRKKVSYISADDLLVGRELDKTREENYNDQRKFGVIDMSKIKIKGPNSLKILGFTVISDSVKTK